MFTDESSKEAQLGVPVRIRKIDFPGDSLLVEQVKDGIHTLHRRGWRMSMAVGSGAHQIHAVRLGFDRRGRKPSIGGGELRGQKIMGDEIIRSVITHAPNY